MKIENDNEFLAVADELACAATAATKAKAALEEALQAVRDEHAPALDALKVAMADKAKALTQYLKRKGVEERLFKPGQRQGESSKALFGWRDSAPSLATLNTKEKMEELARRLYGEGKTQFLLLGAPSVDKDAVKRADLTDAQLAELGLRRVVKTTFYCELKDRVATGNVTAKA